jgi:hypothetical protein
MDSTSNTSNGPGKINAIVSLEGADEVEEG